MNSTPSVINSGVQIVNNIESQICNDYTNVTTTPDTLLYNTDENIIIKPLPKKRGRKPKGGKIIMQTLPIIPQKEVKPNIILHLKCSMKDLHSDGDHNSNFSIPNIESFNFECSKNEQLYEVVSNPIINIPEPVSTPEKLYTYNEKLLENITYISNTNTHTNSTHSHHHHHNQSETGDYQECCESTEIWKKLKMLEHNLHVNNVSDKKSACFWCSHDFDNPPIYIPKHFIKNSYQVYGCFCTPECAVAHLMEDNIDTSTKFERYHLLNHIYSKIYNYKKNIKPAPNPYYMLERFYGNLTIQEYRSLLKSERLFLIVDKPLTRILPEFHEDNDDFIINNKIIPSNNYQVKKRLQKKTMTKNNIMNEQFGVNP